MGERYFEVPELNFAAMAGRAFDTLSETELRFLKWNGIHVQAKLELFMMRFRVPGGRLTSAQLARAADLARDFADGSLCVTTRQDLQFHRVPLSGLHGILSGMSEVGIIGTNAGGDCTRNVVTCPLQGVCVHEVGDTRSLVEDLADDPELRDGMRDLPRKNKISVAGCNRACAQTLINCHGWVPIGDSARGSLAWRYYAGGGLGARPQLGRLVFDWVPRALVVPVTRAATEFFRRHGDRERRAHARLKFVVERLGVAEYGRGVLEILRDWGVDGLESITLAKEPVPIEPSYLVGQERLPQRQEGYEVLRVRVPRGVMSEQEARILAQIVDQNAQGWVILTARQNVHIPFVPTESADRVSASLTAAGLAVTGHDGPLDIICCAGSTQCGRAGANTPELMQRLLEEFRSLPRNGAAQPVSIRITGCPSSCAQHWVADIGIQAKQLEGGEGYAIFRGGSIEGEGTLAEHVADVSAKDAPQAVRALLATAD